MLLRLEQRTEVVDDPLWVMGLLDIFDPAMGSIKRMFKWEQPPDSKSKKDLSRAKDQSATGGESSETREMEKSDFDLDAFLKRRLSVDPSKLDELFERTNLKTNISTRSIYRRSQRARHAAIN